MIIDAHTHGIHGGSLDRLADVESDWARRLVSLVRGKVSKIPQLTDVSARVAGLDRNGIDYQVVTPVPYGNPNLMPADAATQARFAKELNDNMARFMEESKGRLITAGSVALEGFDQGGQQEMERAIKTLGLRGFTVSSNLLGKPLDLPEYEAFWAKAEDLNVPVFIHPVPEAVRPYEAVYDLSHIFGWPFETTLALSRLVGAGIMERYPRLKIVSHHLGGMIPFFYGRLIESYDETTQWGDRGPSLPKPTPEYFKLFHYDTAIGGSAPAIKCAYEVFGANQIVFATDAPNGPDMGEGRLASYSKVIRSLNLPAGDTDKILGGNAARLLNLD